MRGAKDESSGPPRARAGLAPRFTKTCKNLTAAARAVPRPDFRAGQWSLDPRTRERALSGLTWHEFPKVYPDSWVWI
jgi:hypothetical protein